MITDVFRCERKKDEQKRSIVLNATDYNRFLIRRPIGLSMTLSNTINYTE